MAMLLDKRSDGSVAFFLDGDLQFDSQDEHIYHEALALPALAIAEARNNGALKALIIGGGDGLTARELLKSKRLSHLDLVDYDSKVLQLAGNEFAAFNNHSLADPRIHVSIEDAREFIKRAAAAGIKYDIIISDFTAPHDAEGAQLHSIEFYTALRELLGQTGVIAVNTASPSGTPEAYWSVFNSILSCNLNPRAYRIFLPSFAAQGYGSDWGFILASPQLITADDINDHLTLAQPRQTLSNCAQIRQMFSFPQEVLDRQAVAAAGSGTSDILVHYLFNPGVLKGSSTESVNTLFLDLSTLSAPRIETMSYVLPEQLRNTLSKWQEIPGEHEEVINRVFELMPALQRFQTREMIADFLSKPAAFLAPINLAELVEELLKRASELPIMLLEELKLLKERLVEFAEDHERLLALGMRSMAVVALVVVMGNLMQPDSVYAKDGDRGGDRAGASASSSSHAGARGGRGGRGGYGRKDGWGGGGYYGGGTYYDGTVVDPVIRRPIIQREVIEQAPVQPQIIERN